MRTSTDFEKQLIKLQIVTNATERDIEVLRNKAEELAKTTTLSPTEALGCITADVCKRGELIE